MAGHFELVDAPDGGYRIKLVDGSGALMAVSVTFPTKRAAAAGVARVWAPGGQPGRRVKNGPARRTDRSNGHAE